MACMRSDVSMSASERACCRMMNGQCGGMQVPASHDCCHKTSQGADHSALIAKAVVLRPFTEIVIKPAVFHFLATKSVCGEWMESPQYSPPTSLQSSISILRI
jgi:hypothetical protein